MKKVTSYLVVVFNAAGDVDTVERASTKEEAVHHQKGFKQMGCDWVKIVTVTSPLVPEAY